MTSPSLLRTWARKVPESWQLAVQRVRRSMRLIWNPILGRWAVVERAGDSSMLWFAGYGYPGWQYIATCENEDGTYRHFDHTFLEELRNRARSAMLAPTRHQRLNRMRRFFRDCAKARREDDRRISHETTEAAMHEYIEPGLAHKRYFSGCGSRSTHRNAYTGEL